MNESPCPRCILGELKPASKGEATYSVCNACHGLLFKQADMVRFLRAVTREIAGSFNRDVVADVIPNQHPPLTCPSCSNTMVSFGYMESNKVTLDRCTRCWLIWVDREELESVVRMFARINLRADQQQAERDELYRHLSLVVSAGNSL